MAVIFFHLSISYFHFAGIRIVPGLSSDPLSSQGISGGWRQQGRYVKLKLQKTASFTVIKSLDVPPEHTHLHPACCLILWKSHVDNVSLPFFNPVLQKFKDRWVSPDCRVEADWLKCAAPQTKLLCWPANIHSVIWSPHTCSIGC